MREREVLCLGAGAFHRVAYVEWGDPRARRAVVCVHGLTGSGRDFDELAAALAEEGYRVVCPDLVGRGASDRLRDPVGYKLRQYESDVATLLARLDVDEVDWIGTSLGGLVGMAVAAREGAPLARLVLNDIGPFMPAAALRRIGDALGADPRFPDLRTAEAYLRVARAPWGRLSDEQWRRMTERTVRPHEDGGFALRYDPRIAEAFAETSRTELELWHLWEKVRCPVLVLRGARSDFLLPETAREMRARGPGAEVIELPECGHTPALMDADQIGVLVEWLARRC
ncbi:MAG TPA: alpha/beta hydrolase [Longimicrobiales bacterium]|nr:alpha/beta hydrolase [Longimicrobiales bacterium]